MRRIDLVFVGVFLLVVLAVVFYSDPRRKLAKSNDAEALNVTLLHLVNEIKAPPIPVPKSKMPDFVVVAQEYVSKSRPEFKKLLDVAIRFSARSMNEVDLLDIRSREMDKSRVVEPVVVPRFP